MTAMYITMMKMVINKLLMKFRKNVFPYKLCNIGIDCLKEAAKKTHDNRGAAAGVIDLKKMPSYANQQTNLLEEINLE